MSVSDKWVRRFSIDETAKHKDGFTIYKITSVLFPLESPEAVTVVSVWKRYSDVQLLHKSMKSLHSGLHLRGTFPPLAKSSFFKRFHQDVIQERAKSIKALLEFVAEHRLLFTSIDFVNFLQTGYPAPEPQPAGLINAIRSSLHLPIEDTPPLEYQTSDEEARSPSVQQPQSPQHSANDLAIDISQIPIYEAADVEIRESPKTSEKLSDSSFESINSLESLGSDLYDELKKVTIDNKKAYVKRNVLPDLIIFDAPSTSKFDDYHTMPKSDSDTVSLSSTYGVSIPGVESRRGASHVSAHGRLSSLSLSVPGSATRTEDSYVFEAGYLLSQAARCEDALDYQRAFDCYKSGIEKMLIGVQTDPDQQRRALIKEKTTKYLAYAEAIYKNHLSNAEQTLLLARAESSPRRHCPLPLLMLQRPYEELAQYRVLAILGSSMMLVLHQADHCCYAMKVIQKIPNNLTEFDDIFHQKKNETRTPILPTVIPYMVPLHAYVETNNLYFLILAYAPGERLFEYIKKYTKSIPNTPARELNLENVFAEPKNRDIVRNDNESIDVIDANVNIQRRIDNKLDKFATASKFDTHSYNVLSDVTDANVNIERRIDNKFPKFATASKIDTHSHIDVSSEVTDANVNIEKRVGTKLAKFASAFKIDTHSYDVLSDVTDANVIERRIDSKSIKDGSSETDIQFGIDVLSDVNENISEVDLDNSVSVDELVVNSQRLLLNVSKALTDVPKICEVDDKEEIVDKGSEIESRTVKSVERIEVPNYGQAVSGSALPPSAARLWGAQLLTALESLHNCGVVCRDLNPSNILLGEGGQLILTYFVGYPEEVFSSSSHRRQRAYVAPELSAWNVDRGLGCACDYWSYGAVMYELLCGEPLSCAHILPFTSHSLLHLPPTLSVEARSLLSQLLTYDPAERLGAGKDGIDEIKQHPYFKHIQWTDVYDSWIMPD